MLPAYTIPLFAETSGDTPIESMVLTPVRELIVGIDSLDYQEYLDFSAKIKFKDGTTKECLVSDLQQEYGDVIFFSEDCYLEENFCGGKFDFLGYEGEYIVNFIDNPYESIEITGLNELIITLNRIDGTKDIATILDYEWRAGGGGEFLGYIMTDIGTFPGGLSFAFNDETEEVFLNRDIVISIGDMKSNTLENNNWYLAFSTSKSLYRSIEVYQNCVCGFYYGRKFTGIDITTQNYDITDLANISAMRVSWKYECKDIIEEIIDGGAHYCYKIFNADDVAEMIEQTFNIKNVDVTKHAGYNSINHTIEIPYDGWGDDAGSAYVLEYIDGRWYGSREYSRYTDRIEYINIILTDEMLLEKISFDNQSLNGWVDENGKWAFYENGVKLTNQWKADSQGWCYLGTDGYMATNKWVKDSKGWCYVGANGYCVTNQWVADSKGWCYLGTDGRMVTNKWVKDSKGWCYVGADGYCVTNKWVADSKGWCYLGADGRMVTNKWVKDSKGWCYVGADGYCLTNAWKADSKGWCYLDANGRMVISNWVKDGGKWYYLDQNGYMVTGTKTIGGKTYKFASNGVWIA